MKIQNNQSGIAHVGMLVISILVVGVISFAGYRVYQSNHDKSAGEVSVPQEESADALSRLDQGNQPDELANVSTSEEQ